MEKGWRPNAEISPSCPRCGSTNTKFCYYNNYSLTQPRYFCKGCRRYWTKGGSLRNVPVGGGCRKNRRGKSLRLSTDIANSKPSGYGSDHLIRSNCGHRGSSSVESSSSMVADGSHIDIALVYANFLNPQPESKSSSGVERTEFSSDLGRSLEFTNSISNTAFEPCVHLAEDSGVLGCLTIADMPAEAPLSDNDRLTYYGGLTDPTHTNQDSDHLAQYCSSHGTSNYALPPLPGEEMTVPQEMLWPNSRNTMDYHSLQVDHQAVFGPETQDPNMLFGNWSPFELSNDHTFSRT
ncbi:hypothetical protein K2173_010194 [Erythroxylum novogranatense]|uniref:Dof zinc finger protein n=1 Tax=Erythroxylum novogranatense TaxID=1862640 RepID=A0AAV8SQV1_9ROSI|nr:hypothetical protein K2173_010194 [Erythroxylum novogranatense]